MLKENKWLETVTYQDDDVKNERTGKECELYSYNMGNGDLYIGIREVGTQLGNIIRISRHGGCSTKNPKLLHSLTLAYHSMAGNEDIFDEIKKDTEFICDEDKDYDYERELITYHCKNCNYELPIKMDKTLSDYRVKFCPCCGFKIKNII